MNQLGKLMDALCDALPHNMEVESSDGDNDSGEIYVKCNFTNERFLVQVKELDIIDEDDDEQQRRDEKNGLYGGLIDDAN